MEMIAEGEINNKWENRLHGSVSEFFLQPEMGCFTTSHRRLGICQKGRIQGHPAVIMRWAATGTQRLGHGGDIGGSGGGGREEGRVRGRRPLGDGRPAGDGRAQPRRL